MNTGEAFRISMETAEMISMMYLEDLTDEEMMHRPAETANHIKWQLGHLIASEHALMNGGFPERMPPLPEGFADRYAREVVESNNADDFDSKEELLRVYREQREETLKLLSECSDEDFDRETGIEYAPTVGAMFGLQGSHYLMHAGQWAVTRRQLGRAPLM